MRRTVWQRRLNPDGITRPAFVFGNVRSGTSMLAHQLSKSWQVKLYNEDHPAAFHHWRLRDLKIIEGLVEDSWASVTLFKPVLETYKTQILLSRFSSAKAFFIFRHFDDVVNSARKRFYNERGAHTPAIKIELKDHRPPVARWVANDFSEFRAAPPNPATIHFIKDRWRPELNLESNIALRWLFVNRLFFDLNLMEEERVRMLQYETIVLNPELEFRELCDFIEIDFEPQITEGIFTSSIQRDDRPSIEPQIREDCEALWQQLCLEFKAAQPPDDPA